MRGPTVVYWCRACRHRWFPCTPRCRGYSVDLEAKEGPSVTGCTGCEVPNRIAKGWPEAHRALARELDALKAAELAE